MPETALADATARYLRDLGWTLYYEVERAETRFVPLQDFIGQKFVPVESGNTTSSASNADCPNVTWTTTCYSATSLGLR